MSFKRKIVKNMVVVLGFFLCCGAGINTSAMNDFGINRMEVEENNNNNMEIEEVGSKDSVLKIAERIIGEKKIKSSNIEKMLLQFIKDNKSFFFYLESENQTAPCIIILSDEQKKDFVEFVKVMCNNNVSGLGNMFKDSDQEFYKFLEGLKSISSDISLRFFEGLNSGDKCFAYMSDENDVFDKSYEDEAIYDFFSSKHIVKVGDECSEEYGGGCNIYKLNGDRNGAFKTNYIKYI